MEASDLEGRGYSGGVDLAALVSFAGSAVRDRFPLDATWHPGNVAWNLKGVLEERQPIRLWSDSNTVVAVGWFVGPGELYIEALPSHEAVVPQVVAWGEAKTPGETLSVRVLERDTRRIAALEALEYRPGEPESVAFRLDLRQEVAESPPPEDATAADCTEIDLEERSACHRDAWSALDHIGIPNARSTFDADLYRSVRTGPLYDPKLDIVVRASTGTLASNCICWADDVSGMGLFEPVGTVAAFRGRGFGRAAVLEGLRRLKSRGMRWARVGTAHFNAPAIATYRSSGFELIDRTRWWTKRLGGQS